MAHLGQLVTAPDQKVARMDKSKDVQWPWSEQGIGFSETCWVGSAL